MTRVRARCALLIAVALILTGCSSTEDGAGQPPTISATAQTRTAMAPATPTQTPAATPAGEDLPAGVLTALVVGTDSREASSFGGLADVIVVVQLSADRKSLNLVSIPRDTYVPIPGRQDNKINSAFAGGGLPLLKDTVSQLFGGLTIDYVVQSNFAGFIALTRWMDGFTVDNVVANSRKVISTGRLVEFPEGEIRLENTDALIYVRERKQLPHGDLDRTERARAALTGMMERLAEIAEDEPTRLVELLPMLYKNVKMVGDIKVDHLPTMIEVGRVLRDEGQVNSVMVPIRGFTTVGGQSVNTYHQARTAELGTALRGGDLSGYIDRYGTSNAPTG